LVQCATRVLELGKNQRFKILDRKIAQSHKSP
jgi:hypothetical protein